MIYLHLLVTDSHSPDVASATDAEFGAWVRMLLYCTLQANGGVIKGAKRFTSRVWTCSFNIEEETVKRGSPLWEWDGDDLVVKMYPAWQDEETRRIVDECLDASLLAMEELGGL